MGTLTRFDQLQSFCERARKAQVVALDMEFERERTFRPILQLVQLSVADADGQGDVLVDPLELKDLSPLWDLICDPKVEVVLHAGSQDMEIAFIESGGRPPKRVFDTQIAAAMLGMGEQPGYADLVRRLTGRHLKKGERTTNWGKRPLTPAQERYALDDVVHLLDMWRKLEEELQERGRRQWLTAELAFYEDEGFYVRDRAELWRRVSRHRTLNGPELAILRELAAWREDTAAQRDVPRPRVVNDDVLVELARRRPHRLEDLRQLRRLHPREIERGGEEILAAVQRGLACPEEEFPSLPRRQEDDADLKVTVDLLATFVRYRSREVEIAPTYLASKSQIKAFARAHRREAPPEEPVDLATGWRYELVGRDLERFLMGELGLAVDPERGRLRLLPLAGGQTD